MRKSLKYLILSALVFATWALPLCGQEAQRQRKAKLEKEIAIIDKQLAANASKSSDELTKLSLVRKKISNRKAIIAQTDKQIAEYNAKINAKQREINKLNARVDTLESHYSRLVLSAYKNRDARLWYMHILSAEDIGQAYRRFGYFRNLSSQMNSEAKKIRVAQEELKVEKEKLAELKSQAQKVKNEQAQELAKLKKEEAESDRVVAQLKKNRKKYEAQLAAKKKQVNALNKEIERIVAQAVGGGSKGGKKKPVDVKLSGEFSANKGKLPWPAEGPVVEHFGQRYHPVYKNLKLPFNSGINIALGSGTEVKAVFNGVVSQIVVMPGYNQCVLVQHGNYFTFYCRLKGVKVKAGDKITTGQVLGTVDNINGETMLHFQLWQGTKPQNPEHWLR